MSEVSPLLSSLQVEPAAPPCEEVVVDSLMVASTEAWVSMGAAFGSVTEDSEAMMLISKRNGKEWRGCFAWFYRQTAPRPLFIFIVRAVGTAWCGRDRYYILNVFYSKNI